MSTYKKKRPSPEQPDMGKARLAFNNNQFNLIVCCATRAAEIATARRLENRNATIDTYVTYEHGPCVTAVNEAIDGMFGEDYLDKVR